ncbi:MAG: opacity protein-like surface antigen [Candidatus Midichloriaceae bacterium]|jgi:opacity protein-like surface antigen
MKKLLLLSIFLYSILPINQAYSLDNFYTKLEFGESKATKLKNKFYPDNYKGGDYNMYKKSPKNSIMSGLGFGYQFNDNIRSDITITNFKSFKYDVNTITSTGKLEMNQDLSSNAFMANLYYSFKHFSKTVYPFIGVGVGLSSNKTGPIYEKYTDNDNNHTELNFDGKRKNNFAWNALVGFGIDFTQRVNIDVFYKYMDLGKFQSKDTTYLGEPYKGFSTKIKTHNFGLGIRLKF